MKFDGLLPSWANWQMASWQAGRCIESTTEPIKSEKCQPFRHHQDIMQEEKNQSARWEGKIYENATN